MCQTDNSMYQLIIGTRNRLRYSKRQFNEVFHLINGGGMSGRYPGFQSMSELCNSIEPSASWRLSD